MSGPPVVLFALHRERMPFWRSFPVRHASGGEVPAWHCGAVQIVHTGMGATSIERAMTWLLPQRPPCVILAGFSGGLVPLLDVGTLVLATEVRTPTGTTYPVTLHSAGSARLAGPVLTSNRIAGTKAEKHALHAATGAIAVDLESATAARICHEAGVPFGCVRVISDGVDTDLPPELERITDGESVRVWPLLKALCCRPTLLGELLGLARATRLAARNLATGLHEVVRSLRPG